MVSGASGDLTQRKLIPALLNLDRQQFLPQGCSIVGVARRMREAVDRHSGAGAIEPAGWDAFRHFYG